MPDLVIVCVPGRASSTTSSTRPASSASTPCASISAGFAEVDEEGEARQADLMERARGHGLRIIGPNCMGLLNGNDDVRMNGTFSQTFPAQGRVSMSSQSGALGLAVLEHVDDLGLGISTFVSVGNKADISGNDLLQYWEEDDDTDVILMYLESLREPAQVLAHRPPRVAQEADRGGQVGAHHAPACAPRRATPRRSPRATSAVDALFRQTGVIRTDTLEEMFEVATLLASQGLPSGDKVAILTNAGGPGHPRRRRARVQRPRGPAAVGPHRRAVPRVPARRGGHRQPGRHDRERVARSPTARSIEVLGNADEIDMVFVIFIPTGTTATDDVAQALVEAKANSPRTSRSSACSCPPTGITAGAGRGRDPLVRVPRGGRPCHGPRSAATRRGAGARSASRSSPTASTATRARRIVDEALAVGRGRRALAADAAEAEDLLRAYGVPLARSRVVATADEAARDPGGVRRPGRREGRRADPQGRRRRRRARARLTRGGRATRSSASAARSSRRGSSSTPTASWSRRWWATASRWSSA